MQHDKHLRGLIPNKPRFIYKKAPTIRDNIVRNAIDPPTNKTFTFFDGKGFYAYGRYYSGIKMSANLRKIYQFTVPVTGKQYSRILYHVIPRVVYGLRCPCNKLYIGRMKRALKERKNMSTILI